MPDMNIEQLKAYHGAVEEFTADYFGFSVERPDEGNEEWVGVKLGVAALLAGASAGILEPVLRTLMEQDKTDYALDVANVLGGIMAAHAHSNRFAEGYSPKLG